MSTLAVNSITDANGGNTATINSMTPTADSLQGFRNRIINGDMRISQRGTSFAGLTNGSSQYTLDRWRWGESGTATAIQTVSQDSTVPTGFTSSLKVLTTTAQSPLDADNSYRISQYIEGNNISDLSWGTANAKTVTLSFWVRSSITGTFGGRIINGDANRFYVFSYSINSADTWEYKTVTIAGDTTGTWQTNNSSGIVVEFSLGAGATYLTTSGSWGSTRFDAPTGQVNVAGTLNATWYITGVQLEVGSVATPFERRPFGTELSLCQRYFIAFTNTVFGGTNNRIATGAGGSSTLVRFSFPFPVAMRSAPSVTMSGTPRAEAGSAISITSANAAGMNIYSAGVDCNAASGLTAGSAYAMDTGSGGYSFSSEL